MQSTRKELLGFYPKTSAFVPAKRIAAPNSGPSTSSTRVGFADRGERIIYALPNVLANFGDMLFAFSLFHLGDKTWLRRASLLINGKRMAAVDSAIMQKDVYDRIPLAFVSAPLHGYLMQNDKVHVELEFVGKADMNTQLIVEYRQADPNQKRLLLEQRQGRAGPYLFTATDGRMGHLFYQDGHLYWTSRFGHLNSDPQQPGGFEEFDYNSRLATDTH